MMPWELINEQVGEIMKVEIDRELVQVVTVVCGTIVAVACLAFDGELGYAMGTSILTGAGTFLGYVFGKGGSGGETDAEEVPQ